MVENRYNLEYRSITLPDILFIVWILYSALRCLFSFEYGYFYPYGCICVCYLLSRYFRPRSFVVYVGIICIGIWQATVAICQYFHWMDSNHRMFDITGSFGNPGQLGGFLAISTITTICTWYRFKKNRYATWLFVPVLIQGYALLLSDSRAGWLATISGVATLWILGKERLRFSKKQLMLFGISAIVIIGGLYKYKPQSANGRLLVWRVTMDMIADKPILGHGVGGFNRNYMYYQANYFTEYPESTYSQYSDNIAYPYNELLHILADQGIIGLLLILGLLVAVLKTPASNYEYKAAVIGYIVFAQFSYSSYVPGLLVLFPILIGSIKSKPLIINIQHCLHWGMAVLSIGLLGYVGTEYAFRKQCRETIPQLFSENPSKVTHARQFAETHYHRLLSYSRMADVYGQYLYAEDDSERSINVLNDLKQIVPTSELYCDLGDLYKSVQDYERAVTCYQTAHKMIPRRLTPLYKLFKVYHELGDTISARKQAQQALSIPIQVENTRTLKMKAEMKSLL